MGVCFKGYLPIARLLIDAGAEVNRRNSVGQTALMIAALFDQWEIIDLLLANGADAGLTDAAGNTVKTLAIAQGNTELAARFAS